jgi:hypothetical protein
MVRRLILSLFGIAIVFLMWRWSTNYLYSLPATSIAAYTSITINAQYVVGALVIFFVTGRMVYDWKNTTSSAVDVAGSVIEEIKGHIPGSKHFDDGSIS